MHPETSAGRRGFTLLEALVATAVVALIFVPVLNSIVAGAEAAHVADRQLGARLVLDRLLAAVPVGRAEVIPKAAGRDGDFAWTVRTSRASDAPQATGAFVLYRVEIAVSGGGAAAVVDTYRLGPP